MINIFFNFLNINGQWKLQMKNKYVMFLRNSLFFR